MLYVMFYPLIYNMGNHFIQQGQKLLKKESDVGMLLTGLQSTETSCM